MPGGQLQRLHAAIALRLRAPARRVEVEFGRLLLVGDPHEARGVGGLLEALGGDQHDRLPGIVDAVVLQRQQHLDQAAFARILDALHLVGQRLQPGRGEGRDHRHHAGQRLRLGRVHRRDPAARDGAADHDAVHQPLGSMLRREGRIPGDLQPAVGARDRLADAARLERNGGVLTKQTLKHGSLPRLSASNTLRR